jgi:uncharacterized membrane protein YkvA (DUF1232 family)
MIMLCIVLLSVVGMMGMPHLLHTPPWASGAQSPFHHRSMQSAAISDPHSTQCFVPAYRCSSYARRPTHNAVPWVVNVALGAEPSALVAEPFEDQLSAGVTSLFKSIRYGVRRATRFLRWSVNRWAVWMLRALGFFVLAVLAPLVNRDLLAAWREKGWQSLRTSIRLGVAVYMRLLLDRHAPLFGKLAIAFALAYGVASRDLVPDASLPLGVLDDAFAIVLASRAFMLLCPESLVEEHAILAARAGERRRTWQRLRIPPPAG